MNKFKKNLNFNKLFYSNYIFLNLILLLVLSIYILLAFFAFPFADDYCWVERSKEIGFINHQFQALNEWNGRYTSNTLIILLGFLSDLFKSYTFVIILTLILFFISIFFLLNTFLIKKNKFSKTLFFTLAFILVYFSALPDISQTIYWLSGNLTYQSGNILTILLISALIYRSKNYSKLNNFFINFFCFFLTFLAIGTNEITLLVTLFTLSIGLLLNKILKNRDNFWIIIFLFGLLVSCFSIFSPGNFKRLNTISDYLTTGYPNLVASLLYLPWSSLRFFYWISNLSIWIFTVIFFINFKISFNYNFIQNKTKKKSLKYFFLLFIFFYFILQCVGFILNKYPLPERAESVIGLYFILGLIFIFIFYHQLLKKNRVFIFLNNYRKILNIIFVVTILGNPNIFEIFKDVYLGFRYYNENVERVKIINTHKVNLENYEHLFLPSLSRMPKTLSTRDISTNPDNLSNYCMAKFYGIKSLSLGKNIQ